MIFPIRIVLPGFADTFSVQLADHCKNYHGSASFAPWLLSCANHH
jgi:hypothetical protein